MMIVMVFFMPYVDRKICAHLGVSLDDRPSRNPNADQYLHLRKILLIIIFIIYLMGVAYVVFFSRSAYDDYKIHIALYQSLASSIHMDFGFLSFFRVFFNEGFKAAMSHVKINGDSISQVYLNVMMTIPLGYLLPYVFDWYRKNIGFRTVLTGFLVSLTIENAQLIFKRGFYDIDDLFSNTLGTYIGQWLYVLFAYFLTHPDFKKDFLKLKRWRNRAKTRAIYPFFSKIHISRVSIYGSDRKEIFDFYENKLGFRLYKLEVYDEENADFLFDFGKNQIEVRCIGKDGKIPQQNIMIACNNSEYLKKNLEKHGIKTSDYEADRYTGLRTFRFTGPDHTLITIIEE